MKRKKILSLLVSLAMVLLMLPTVAFAADAYVSTEQDLLDAIDAAEDGDTITLSADIDLSDTLTIGSSKNITIDLAGNVITRTGTGSVIRVVGELTLEDSDGNGTIIGGNTSTSGGGVYVTGTFTMNGGTITENTATNYGGDVYVGSTGTFIMTDGAISDNTASTNAGGVFVNGSFTMEGGAISDNTAITSGGGIYVGSTGEFTMTGGAISNNTATVSGGGVYVDNTFTMTGGTISENTARAGGGVFLASGHTFSVSGSPIVTDNTDNDEVDNNVYLANERYITLDAALTDGAEIGVTTETQPSGTDGIQITSTEDGTAYYATAYQYFIPDAEDVLRNANSDGYVEFISSEGYHTVTIVLENATTEDEIYYAVFPVGGSGFTTTITTKDGYMLPETFNVTAEQNKNYTIGTDTGSTISSEKIDDYTVIITIGGISEYGKSYTITLVAEAEPIYYTVTFNYNEDAYTVTLPDSSVIESGSTVTYVVGESCVVTVTPLAEEYELPDEITIFAEATGTCEKGSTYASNQVEYTDEGVIKITGVTWTNDNTDGKDYVITIGTQVAVEETYDITVDGSDYVSTDPAEDAAADEEVTVTPDEGYIITEIAVADENGNTVECTGNEDGTYSFTMPESAVVVTVTTKVAYTITFVLENVDIDPEELEVTCAIGDKYTVAIEAADGYTLSETITVDADKSGGICTAGTSYYGQVDYTIDGDAGTITITGQTKIDGSGLGKDYVITISAEVAETTYAVALHGETEYAVVDKDEAAEGETVIVTVEDGYEIVVESDDAEVDDPEVTDNGDGTYSFEMPASSVTITVSEEVTYTITFVLDNVTIDPEDEFITYVVGESYTVTVTPDTGYTLPDYITIDAQSTGTCNIGETYSSSSTQVEYTTDGEIIITGIVRTDNENVGKDYTITISAEVVETTYAVELDGETEYAEVDKEEAAEGETVTVTVDEGYTIVVESDDDEVDDPEVTDNGDGTYSFEMPASSVTITVSEEVTYTITFVLDNVTIDPDDESVTCVVGESYTVTVTPDEGYTLPDYITVDADVTGGTCEAGETYYDQVTYTVDGESGTIVITGETKINGSGLGKDYTITISAVEEDTEGEYEITLDGDGADYVTVDPESATADEGDTVTITPDDGYVITDITVTDENGDTVECEDNGDGTYSFTMPASDVTVEVEVEEEPEGEYAIDLDGSNVSADKTTADEGDTVTITPEDGYTIKDIIVESDDDEVDDPELIDNGDGTYSFEMPASDVTVTVETKAKTYDITVKNTSHGDVETDPEDEAQTGEEVTIDIDPDSGYKVKEVTVTDEDGNEIDTDKESSTEYTFIMPASDVTVKVTFTKKSSSSSGGSYSLSEGSSSSSSKSSSSSSSSSSSDDDTMSDIFTDLSTSHEYYDAIMEAYENGWMVGTSDTTFEADGYLTRAMAAQILWNLEGNPEPVSVAPFIDVTSDAWYADAVAWAYENGIVIGYDYINYGPNDYVTMEQFCIMLAKYRGEVVPEYIGNSPYATRGWVAYMITA